MSEVPLYMWVLLTHSLGGGANMAAVLAAATVSLQGYLAHKKNPPHRITIGP